MNAKRLHSTTERKRVYRLSCSRVPRAAAVDAVVATRRCRGFGMLAVMKR